MARKPYTLPDGTEVPSVTTILREDGDGKEGLMGWAFKIGKEGKYPTLRAARMAAANAGSIVHALARCRMFDRPYVRAIENELVRFTFPAEEDQWPETYLVAPEVAAKADESFKGFEGWLSTTNLKPVAPEAKVYSIRHRYAGRLDLLAMLGDELDLLDFKSAKAFYGSMLLQVAAYRAAWEEMHPDLPVRRVRIMRWGDQADRHEHVFEDTSTALEMFLHLRQIHDLRKRLPRAA